MQPVRWILFGIGALFLVAAVSSVTQPVSISGSTTIVEDGSGHQLSRSSTDVSCRTPIVDAWNGSHVQQARSNGLPASYCRTHSRQRVTTAVTVLVLGLAVAGLGWFLGRRKSRGSADVPAPIADT